jgi:hypothetical protein
MNEVYFGDSMLPWDRKKYNEPPGKASRHGIIDFWYAFRVIRDFYKSLRR